MEYYLDEDMRGDAYKEYKDTKFKANVRTLRNDQSIKRRKWTEAEDLLLIEKFNEGLGISLIALLHKRTEKAIMFRLQKLQLYPKKQKDKNSEESDHTIVLCGR